MTTDTMAAITVERERITQRIARDQAQLEELTAAERVLSRFTKTPKTKDSIKTKTPTKPAASTGTATRRKRGRPASTKTDAPTAKRTRGPAETSLSNLTLEAARARPGQTGAQITAWINETYKMSARPNHVGAMLERHGRAGRLTAFGEAKSRTWYVPTAIPMAKAS